MSLLDAAELLEIQSLAESGMTGTATILTRGLIETENGQESIWVDSGDAPCWVKEITSAGATLGGIAGAVAISENFSVRLPVGTAAFSGDRLGIGSTLYDIQHSNADDTYPAWLVCNCRVVE